MGTAAAKRYARAVFELAQEEGGVDQWGTKLERVRVLFEDPDVAAVLSNPTIPSDRREALIEAALGGLDEQATNLARLLVEQGRIEDAPEIEKEFQRLADAATGRVRALATSAVELTAEDRERVAYELSQRLKQDVRLSVAVDPRILGGLKLQFGDHVIDASLATRLQQLRRRLATN